MFLMHKFPFVGGPAEFVDMNSSMSRLLVCYDEDGELESPKWRPCVPTFTAQGKMAIR